MMDGVSVAFLTDRDVFGHVEVVLPHSRRLATTIASEATSAVKIPRQVYLTLWPEAEGHKADIQFLRHLPGMSRVSPKSIMYLHYNILTHTYQVG